MTRSEKIHNTFFICKSDTLFDGLWELIVVYYFQALSEHEVEIPETINTQTLVKDLAKEIRLVEVNKQMHHVSSGEIVLFCNAFVISLCQSCL